ncbi:MULTISPECIES: CdaR family transcriptional regulator [unclassified Exiguobacterium]|uniref:PucR family transcriptional regulator n=1 Tax=unclassified Exiguobacterium TaxID=2644629 RepID=UPI00103DEBD7|nr:MULTISPECIES: helix-turn-helix domain-containing protein [unclassified Exiguobacterium]TCI34600.1 PucR family transcriptional regulator [Exiguobacterium sp. SH4S7]TCI44355.1 PucR family transcriptional regulator [Exiguobacterium sp. SH5S32]TCI50619.1 PucR family transcriptional regulator [Exiguobacterium sp. SH1S4]TCI60674.1 PucR family transcriptional regulator [Exiguobacterium sp. SH0S2]TCI69579.1 PucR family transcriptional regulator [Exiguobacterium sp. SH1S1]
MPFLQKSYESLDTLAEAIGQAIRAPITIENRHHQLLAYSTHPDSTDPARIATIIGRRVPEAVIEDLWESGILQELIDRDEPVVIPARMAIGLGERAAVVIKQQEDVLGYIWSLARTTPFSEQELTVLKEGASIAKKLLMTIAMHERRIDAELERFFLEVLASPYLASAHRERLNELAPIAVASRLTIIDCLQPITPQFAERLFYALATQEAIEVVLHAIDGQQLLVWHYMKSELSEEEGALLQWAGRFETQLQDKFTDAEPRLGISGRFFESDTLYAATEEARRVTSLRRKFPFELASARAFEQIGIYQLVPDLSRRIGLRLETHPTIERLQAYDQVHRTELVTTLEWYFYFDGNVKRVAAHLHIHPNTVLYRIRRIEELTSITQVSLPERAAIYLAIKAGQYRQDD